MKKIQCQSSACVSRPPVIRPIDAARHADERVRGHRPDPLGRVGELDDDQREHGRGADRGADALHETRGDQRPSLPAKPHSSDAPVKIAMPARNMRVRPTRSASRPPSSRKLPNAIRYALGTQVSDEAEK